MPRYELITKSGFAAQAWRRHNSYAFAATDAVAPLVVTELAKACMCLPIAFMKQNDTFVPHAVQGLEPGRNLFVVNGTWVASYTPAAYRGYPFALAQGEVDQLHLCIDMDSGLVGAGEGFDQPFFDEAGEAAQPVKDALNFLQQIYRNRAVTQRVCAALAAEDLFQPWPLTVQGPDGERRVDGLFRIDEARLNSLDPEALARVQKAGGLPVAYCQLLSMGNIQTLGLIARKLDEVKNRMPEMSDQIDVDGILQRHKANDNLDSLETDNDRNLVNVVADEGDFDLSSFVNSKHRD
ncbi:SapC family protein [Yoonia vestfoldensis]|uniref:SAPC family protein n=1 Tax=Yoonia vestfoldensis SKA53 TaxID=314232 RepID=A3V908_9RHOB|nr:SapC family protein [Yoonia vestfoldensis]EAQ05371.1 SAPC family protein [Yoonia vestfoldensis SKA53]